MTAYRQREYSTRNGETGRQRLSGDILTVEMNSVVLNYSLPNNHTFFKTLFLISTGMLWKFDFSGVDGVECRGQRNWEEFTTQRQISRTHALALLVDNVRFYN